MTEEGCDKVDFSLPILVSELVTMLDFHFRDAVLDSAPASGLRGAITKLRRLCVKKCEKLVFIQNFN